MVRGRCSEEGGGGDGSSRASIDPVVFPSTMCYCVAPSLYDFKPTEEEHEGGGERGGGMNILVEEVGVSSWLCTQK